MLVCLHLSDYIQNPGACLQKSQTHFLRGVGGLGGGRGGVTMGRAWGKLSEKGLWWGFSSVTVPGLQMVDVLIRWGGSGKVRDAGLCSGSLPG